MLDICFVAPVKRRDASVVCYDFCFFQKKSSNLEEMSRILAGFRYSVHKLVTHGENDVLAGKIDR